MGSAMAAHLLKAGHAVLGYDVAAAARSAHRRAGGSVAADAAHVASAADTIITSLPSAQALLDTVAALTATAGKRHVVIETSTLPIAVKEAARLRLARHGALLLDCPLSGTAAQARNKDLVVYASGSRAACRRVAPILDGFSRAHHYVGAVGAR